MSRGIDAKNTVPLEDIGSGLNMLRQGSLRRRRRLDVADQKVHICSSTDLHMRPTGRAHVASGVYA
jgi:hypothetical protein